MRDEIIELENVLVGNETDMGWWMNFDGEEVCVPKSLIDEERSDGVHEGAEITVAIPEWFALKEGLV